MVDLTDPYDVNETLKEKDRRIYVLEAQVARLTAAQEQQAAEVARLREACGKLWDAGGMLYCARLMTPTSADRTDDIARWAKAVVAADAALAPPVQAEEER